jgi:hypothetical protein
MSWTSQDNVLHLSILHSGFDQSQTLKSLTKHNDKYINIYNMKYINMKTYYVSLFRYDTVAPIS